MRLGYYLNTNYLVPPPMIHMGSMSQFLLQNWYTNSYVKKKKKEKKQTFPM